MNKKLVNKIVWWIPNKDIRNIVRESLKSLPDISTKKVFNKFKNIKDELSDNRFVMEWEDRQLYLNDATGTTSFEPHYTYHTAWAARLLKKLNIKKHIDISSSFTGFATIVSAFVDIDFYDIRPAKINLSGLKCFDGSILNLPFDDNSIDSISCMHVIEHIGLERYGDDYDPKGDIKGINELIRVTKNGGYIIFVVPMAELAKIQYNAHRIYTYDMIIEYFKSCKLIEFSLIKDNAQFIENASKEELKNQNWSCGCFLFQK